MKTALALMRALIGESESKGALGVMSTLMRLMRGEKADFGGKSNRAKKSSENF